MHVLKKESIKPKLVIYLREAMGSHHFKLFFGKKSGDKVTSIGGVDVVTMMIRLG